MSIFISAGHKNNSDGANYKKKFFEHEQAVLWRDIICELLGVKPVPVGTLEKKVAYINKHESGSTIAIEIHFNSAMSKGRHIGRGCETLHHPKSKNGIALANVVHQEIVKTFSPNRGLKAGYYRMNPKNQVDYFLRKTRCPSIIIEPDFIHRYELITTSRRQCTRDIVRALLTNYGECL